jgi:hypothetical protein
VDARIEVIVDLSTPPVLRSATARCFFRAVSDAAGLFAIPGVPRGLPLVLAATHPNFVAERVARETTRGEPQPVVIRLGLAVASKDAWSMPRRGAPPALRERASTCTRPMRHRKLRRRRPPRPGATGRSSSSGSGRGAKTSSIGFPGRVLRRAGAVLGGAGAVARVGDVALAAGVPFDGVVENADGLPVFGGVCEARRLGGGSEGAVVADVRDGRFVFAALRPGTYALVLKDASGTPCGTAQRRRAASGRCGPRALRRRRPSRASTCA